MKQELSILIPTFNDSCITLVKDLCRQAEQENGLSNYEIVVADDASTATSAIDENQTIRSLPHCRLLTQPYNRGRAAIRNILAEHAQYRWILFIDADSAVISDHFLRRYLESEAEVACGGYRVAKGAAGNLRYMYEQKNARQQSLDERKRHPSKNFKSSNFLISKQLFKEFSFDTRFKHYGYEDVLFGKRLSENGIRIEHINAPVGFHFFEPNDRFVQKTEESLRTLHTFRSDLKGYSRLADTADRLKQFRIDKLVSNLLHPFMPKLRRQLCGPAPSLLVFKLYKLGYYLSL